MGIVYKRLLAVFMAAAAAGLIFSTASHSAVNQIAVQPDIVCDLAPSGNHVIDDGRPENASCLQVQLLMDAPPAVGQTAQLTVKIQASQGVSGSSPVVVSLPKGLSFSSLARGFRQQNVANALDVAKADFMGDGSSASRAVGSISLVPGTNATAVFNVKANAAGAGSIQAHAEIPAALRGPGMVGGSSSLHASYGLSGDANGTHWGLPAIQDQPARAVSRSIPVAKTRVRLQSGKYCPGTQTAPPTGKACPAAPGLAEEVQLQTDTQSAAKVHAEATACSKGRFVYSDNNGVVHPSINLAVHVYDINSTWDDELASGMTDWNGDFNICYDNSEHSFWGSGTADIQLRFKTRNNRWEVKNYSDGNYVINTDTREQSNGSTRDWGTMTASSSSFQRALHAFDLYNTGWNFSAVTSPSAGDCWTSGDCSRRKVLWEAGEDPWPHYGGSAGDAVSLSTDAPDYYWVVLHELGHNVMAHAYSGGIPSPTGCPDPHYLTRNENSVCAWVEGWPTWWAGQVLGVPIIDGYGGDANSPWSAGEALSWENYNSIHRGSNVEGRIMSALWDLTDSSDEAPWDRKHLGFDKLWTTFLDHDDSTWSDFVGSLSSEGVDVHSSDFLSTLYGNTIDSVSDPFRDPLKIGWSNRPIPPVSPPSTSSTISGGSDVPRDTSNNHNWVWERSDTPSACGDTVRIESLISASTDYRVSSGSAVFPFTDWKLESFANQSMFVSLGSASTGTSSLKSVGSLTLTLPDYPRNIYVRLSGRQSYPGSDGHVPWAAAGSAMINHYKIHAVRCFGPISWGAGQIFKNVNWGSVGIIGADVGQHSVLVRPSSRDGKGSNTHIRIWRLSQDVICQQEPDQQGCQPTIVAETENVGDRGLGKRLSFHTDKDDKYKIEWENLTTKPVDWSVIAK